MVPGGTHMGGGWGFTRWIFPPQCSAQREKTTAREQQG